MDREFKYQTAFRRKHNYLYELGVDKNILDKTQKTHNQKGKKKELHKKKKHKNHSWLLKSPVRKYIGRAVWRKMQVIHLTKN